MAIQDPIIDILTVIDAESLVRDYASKLGTKDSPTSLGNNAAKYVYMLVKRSEANNMEAQPELSVAVKTRDKIRWRASSLTVNTVYSIVLYDTNRSSGYEFITKPTPYTGSVLLPKPTFSAGEVTPGGTQSFTDFYFEATANYPGQVTYQLYIMLTDNRGHPIGYFNWDPYLTITQS